MTRQEGTDQGSYPPVSEHAIGKNLRHLVGMHDLLQREVAAYIGLSPQGLWNILNGRSEPRSRTVRDCARAFGVSIDDLFSDTGTCVRAAAAVYERAPRGALARGEGPSDPPLPPAANAS